MIFCQGLFFQRSSGDRTRLVMHDLVNDLATYLFAESYVMPVYIYSYNIISVYYLLTILSIFLA